MSPIVRRFVSQLVDQIPLVAVTTCTAATFVQVFGDWHFLAPLVIMALTTHIACAVGRTLRWRAVVSLGFSLASLWFCLGHQRYASTLRWNLPLAGTWTAMWTDLESAFHLLGNVVTPVDFATGFGTASLIAIGAIAIATDAFAARFGARVEVFVPAAATLLVVAAIGTGRHRIALTTAWFVVAILTSTYLRVRSRVDRSHSVTRSRFANRAWLRAGVSLILFASIVGAIAALVGPRLPGAGQEAWLTRKAGGGTVTLAPLVDLRRRLTDPGDSILFTVDAERSSYWKMTSLPDFDGDTWTVDQDLYAKAAGELVAPPGAQDPGVVTSPNLQRITIENLAGSVAPIAQTPTQLRSSTQSLFYDDVSGTLIMGGAGLRREDSYEIQSSQLSPRPERLMSATTNSPPDDRYLVLPDTDVTRRLARLANSIVASRGTPYERALALQEYFRSQYTYSLDVPVLDGADAMVEFIQRKTGYCEHFASTFAVLARSIGLPARVAIGFTPGDREATSSTSLHFIVRSSHAHAWPEVWFDGIGWVLFEPTPGRGAPDAAYSNVPEQQSPPTTLVATTTLAPGAESVPPTSPIAPTPLPSVTGSTQEPSTGDGSLTVIVIALVLAGIALWGITMDSALSTVAARVNRRRDEPCELILWRRVLALYEFERGPFDPSLSPHEIALAATARLYNDDTFIVELADVVTRVLFASGPAFAHDEGDLCRRGEDYLKDRISRLALHHRLRIRFDPFLASRLLGLRRR